MFIEFYTFPCLGITILNNNIMGTLIFMAIAGIMVAVILVSFYLKRNKVRDKDIKKELYTHNDNKTSDWE